MKRIAIVIFILSALGVQAKAVKHQFLAIDNGYKKLIYVDQFNPENSWAVPCRGRDIQLIDESTIMTSAPGGARFYRLSDGKELTEKTLKNFGGVQSARKLKNGNIMLAGGNVVQLISPDGKRLKEIDVSQKVKPLIRLVRETDDGTFLFASDKPYSVVEMDWDGNIVHQTFYTIPEGKGYKHIKLKNGNTLNSTGNPSAVIEMDPAGKVVRAFGGKKAHPDLGLDFCSGWDVCQNGNVVMTNWLGHKKHGQGVHLAEFDKNNRCVWQWEDHKLAKQITNVLIIK